MRHEQQSPESSPPPVALLSYPRPDTTVCTVTCNTGTDTTRPLRDALAEAVCDASQHLVIDLSAVTFLDSTGLRALFTDLDALFTARRHPDRGGGGHLAVVIDSNTRAIPQLYVVALETAFDLHDDLADAVHACATAATRSPAAVRR